MKHTVVIFLSLALVMLTSCEKSMTEGNTEGGSTPTTPSSQATVPVNFTFFDVSTEDIVTPADSRADDEGETDESADEPSQLKKNNYITQLSVAIFPLSGVGETQQFYQTNQDEDFGKISVELPIGQYQIVAVAYKGEHPVTIESKNLVTFPDKKVTDMVAFNKTIDVASIQQTCACAMERVMTAFTLQSTDKSPEEVTAVRATFKSHCNYQYDPARGLITKAQKYSSTVFLDADKAGETRRLTFYTLLDQPTQENVAITVELLDKDDNVLNRFDFDNVKLEKGKRTTYTGELFAKDASMDFTSDITSSEIPPSDGDQSF